MRRKIIVLRGGPSSEYEVSLKTGRSVIDALVDSHDVRDIVIDKQGDWLHQGFIVKPEEICTDCDCVFNAMHGEYGEDGEVQKILESIGIPFTGPKKMAAVLSINKDTSKEIYKKHGIKTPLHKVISKPESEDLNAGIDVQAALIVRTFPMPVIVKPVSLGSSVGIVIVRDMRSLVEALQNLYQQHDRVMIEEYITGREATVGVLEKFRDQDAYPLLPIEIRTPVKSDFFDYDAKYSGETDEISPGNFSTNESKEMQEAAIAAHNALGLRHYSRSDFILHPRRGLYILETNSLPGLTTESLLPKSFAPVSTSYEDFLKHIIELALEQ